MGTNRLGASPHIAKTSATEPGLAAGRLRPNPDAVVHQRNAHHMRLGTITPGGDDDSGRTSVLENVGERLQQNALNLEHHLRR